MGTLLLTLVLAGGAGCFWLAAPKVGPLTRTAGQLSPIEWKRALVKSMSTGSSRGHAVVHFSCPFSIQCAIAVIQCIFDAMVCVATSLLRHAKVSFLS